MKLISRGITIVINKNNEMISPIIDNINTYTDCFCVKLNPNQVIFFLLIKFTLNSAIYCDLKSINKC
jgi:hypothetical protein